MAYNRSHASRLCNAQELAMFDASTRSELASWNEKQLADRIAGARRLRDKQQDLLRRQKLAARARTGTKDGRSGVANQRTEQKLKLFSEVLARFEARLAAIQQERARAEARAAAKKPSAAKPPAKAGKAAPRGKGFASPQALEASHRMQLQKSRARPIQAHISSAGKRAQARRDSR